MKTTSEIIFAYEQISQLSQQLLIITEAVREIISKKEMNRLHSKLARREEIIDRLKAIENQLLGHGKPHKKLRAIFMTNSRKTASSFLQKSAAVLEKVKAYDEEITEYLKKEKIAIADELKKVSIRRRLKKSYKTSPSQQPNYFSLSI